MPNPLRFALLQVGGGLGVAAVFLGALLATGPGGVAGLLLNDQAGPLPLLLLWLFAGLTFGAAQFGLALATAEDETGGVPRFVPVRVPAVVSRRARR